MDLSPLPGCLGNGTAACTMLYAPLSIPEAPKPATARPMMSMFEDTAVPQRREPNSKMPKKTRNVHLVVNRSALPSCEETNKRMCVYLGAKIGINLPSEWLECTAIQYVRTGKI
jgi:hypothetical protein